MYDDLTRRELFFFSSRIRLCSCYDVILVANAPSTLDLSSTKVSSAEFLSDGQKSISNIFALVARCFVGNNTNESVTPGIFLLTTFFKKIVDLCGNKPKIQSVKR